MSRYPNSIVPDNWQEEVYKVNEQVRKNKDKEIKTEALSVFPRRSFKKSEITGNKSLAAASIDNLVTVLKTDQLKLCGKAYINNGIVRRVIDSSTFFINPERTDFVIEPNDELTVGLDDEEVKKIEEQIKNNTLKDAGDLQELRRKITRANKRVKLHDRLDKLIASALIFGRGALKIERFPVSDDWPIFGEPLALNHLSTIRIKDVLANKRTGVFEGLTYDTNVQTADSLKTYRAEQLLPAFHDDFNVLDNSNYSGLSAVWPVLEAAQTIDVILAEDMPEIARQSWAKFCVIYAGTSKKSTIRKIKEELEAGTSLVHNEQLLKAEVYDLSLDPTKLTEVITALSKHVCMSMNLPQFLLFEDTANFATANQTMQTYKAGMLKRYRTWLQGILEDYWYDPILADHLGVELKDVISAPIKIKAIFQDINFETRLEIITGDEKLQNMMVFTNVDTAKDIDRKDIANRLQLEQNEINKAVAFQKDQDIKQQMADGKIQNNQQKQQQNTNKKPIPPKR